jgi:hypothetical protein
VGGFLGGGRAGRLISGFPPPHSKPDRPPDFIMSRHVILALGLALVATATALLLADVGFFEPPAHWLFARYEEESLWKGPPSPAWPWLATTTAGLAALLVAWVAVDHAGWSAKGAVLAATLGAVAFLSLTLAFYGVAFNPWPGLTAAALAFAMGCLLAETPAGRNHRQSQTLLGRRASRATLQAWSGPGLTPPWPAPAMRDGAALAVRVLSPPPSAEALAPHLAQLGRSLGDISRFLRARPGVVLDSPASDGVRAFFGFRPDSAGGDLDLAAQTALDLATFLREEAVLQAQAGQPAPSWGLGLSLGSLLTALHGPDEEKFWTASGAPAEQARQLAALNARHQTSILVGRRAAEALAARFNLRPVEGDAIHALLAAKPAPAPDELPLTAAHHEALADTPLAAPSPPEPPASKK